MPFIFDHTTGGQPEDDTDWMPAASQFVYMSATELGGARSPVTFKVPTPADIALEAGPKPPSLWQQLLGRKPATAKVDEPWTDRNNRHARQMLSVVVPELRALGVQTVYCRYDGGNDEGFAWLDSATTSSGERLEPEALIDRLVARGIAAKLYAGGVMSRMGPAQEREKLRWALRDELATHWAAMLLGHGYGTGEYSLYGAFAADLEACTITDDPKADAVTQNLPLAGAR